jgi:hypothetical protein
MIKYQGLCYLDLPKIPDSILDGLNRDYSEYYHASSAVTGSNQINTYSDSFNTEINQWCQKNISEHLYWGFMIMQRDLGPHVDVKTKIKLTYVIDPGGNNVTTEFYENDRSTLLESIVIQPGRWHIFRSDMVHAVRGIEPGQVRFSLTASVFRDI